MATPSTHRTGTASGAGTIDYRLRRASVLADYESGRRAQHEVCDAHPDLTRAARNGLGEATEIDCPVCADGEIVHVTYVFGPRMPASGRCISRGAEELAELARRRGDFTCFVVEICATCEWHHLVRSSPLVP